MTSPRTTAGSTAADHAQTFLDWTKINARALIAGAAVIVVAGAVYWFMLRSREIANTNASTALNNAQQSMASGNAPLAQSDLQTIVQKYGSTGPGVEAAMLLAQMDYDAGKFQDGIAALGRTLNSSAASLEGPAIRTLQGDGYMQLGKPADAAKVYEAAADASPYAMEQAYDRAKAARAYQTAGDTAKARQIWTALANDEAAPGMSSEARVRLGELTAAAAKR
jgi:predicted negative regulator of RcsB-dependent stress response